MRTRTDGVLRAMNGGKRVRTVRAVRLRYVRVRIRVATVGAAGAERDRSAGGSDLHLDDGIPVGSLYWRATNSITFLLLPVLDI